MVVASIFNFWTPDMGQKVKKQRFLGALSWSNLQTFWLLVWRKTLKGWGRVGFYTELFGAQEYRTASYVLVRGGRRVWHLMTAVCFTCFYSCVYWGGFQTLNYDCIQFWIVCFVLFFSWTISCGMKLLEITSQLFSLQTISIKFK